MRSINAAKKAIEEALQSAKPRAGKQLRLAQAKLDEALSLIGIAIELVQRGE